MGSPFPGMDPYLEGDMWHEFHQTLASAIRAQLLPKLVPKYVALLSKRFVFTRPTIGISYESGGQVIYPSTSLHCAHRREEPHHGRDRRLSAAAGPPVH